MAATVEIKKRHLFSTWRAAGTNLPIKNHSVFKEVLKAYSIDSNIMPEVALEVEKFTKVTCDTFQKLWIKYNRSANKILLHHVVFFDNPFKLPTNILNMLPSSSKSVKVGRKPIPFDKCSESTKRRKTAAIREEHQAEELVFATQIKLRESGQKHAADILKEATQTTPSRARRITKSWKQSSNHPLFEYNDAEALALIIDTRLSKSQYIKIQSGAKERNANIYPPYHRIVEAKKSCYPDEDYITVSDTCVEVKLQQLLDHTSERIVDANEESLDDFTDKELLDIKLTVKWGMDGSSGNAEYNQQFENDDGTKSDASVFITSLVPIVAETNGKTFFRNSRPSSTRLCRPIRIQLMPETTELAILEKEYIEQQIEKLLPTEFTTCGRQLRIRYSMLLTMVDGKICSALTGTKSSQRCFVCLAKPTEMNDIDKVRQLKEDETTFQYGLSPLHAWIRFFEYFIHVAYRLETKKWQSRGEDKQKMLERKKKIQKRFKVELGMNVDQPRSGGSGTSNNGNLARKFFANAEKVAEITGLDRIAIQRCGSILQSIGSGYEIDSIRFDTYCIDTARLLVKLYPWYYLPASVHKVLIHGSSIINHFMVPIGQLSEEAQEARNKDWKRYREFNTRKISRQTTNRDLLNMLLVSSDPLITSIRGWPKKVEKSFSDDAKSLLKNFPNDDNDSENDSDHDSVL